MNIIALFLKIAYHKNSYNKDLKKGLLLKIFEENLFAMTMCEQRRRRINNYNSSPFLFDYALENINC